MFAVLLIVLLVLLFYYYNTRTFGYWKDRNIPYLAPIPFFGCNFKNYLQLESRTNFTDRVYALFPNAPYVGSFRGAKPELIVRDPDIVKSILTVDFYNFHGRGFYRDPKIEPLFYNLFHADGDGWKLLRQRLTPAFTSGKLKNMFPLIVECAEQLRNLAEHYCETGEPTDVREMMARFTTDFIGACGFGIKMNSINEEDSKFRDLGKLIFEVTFLTAVKILLKEQLPNLLKNMNAFGDEMSDGVTELLTTILKQRNYQPIGRNDFIDLLLELKSQGKIIAESIEHFEEDGKPKIVEREVDIPLMAGQVFVFFAAGFETSSSATSFTLHQLAYNPHEQVKVQKEIDTVLAKYNNELCYDSVKEMKYLECTFNEALRMFPSLGLLNRVCTKTCKIPGTDICIDKGVLVTIPVSALQQDEKYFSNPRVFDPSRFLPENSRSRNKFAYLPFGEGPRNCIGMRLGQMQSMAGLAALLSRYSFEPAPSSVEDISQRVDPRSNTVQSIVGGLPLIMKKRIDLSLSV